MQIIQGRPAASAPPQVDAVLSALMSIGRLMRQPVPGDTLDVGTIGLLKHLEVHDDGLRLTGLAACAGLDVSTVSRHVAQLHRQGLVDRTPDPDDGRAQRVSLSPHGRERLGDALERRRSRLARSLTGWSADDLDHLTRLLGRVVGGLEDQHAGTESS